MNNLYLEDFLDCLAVDGVPRIWYYGGQACSIAFVDDAHYAHYTVEIDGVLVGHLFYDDKANRWSVARYATFGPIYLWAFTALGAMATLAEGIDPPR